MTGQMTRQWGDPSWAAASGPSFKVWLKDDGSVRVVKSVWYCKHIRIAFVTTSSSQLLFRFSGMDERTERRLYYRAMAALIVVQNYPTTGFWPTILSVAPLVHCFVCLSVIYCLSVACDVLYCDETVRPSEKLKEWIGNQGKKVYFLGCRHISTSSFTSTATEMAVFALFLPVQPSNRY